MHVLIVGDHPLPGQQPRGGVERVVQSLRRALCERVRVTLVVPRAGRELRHSDEAGEIVYYGHSALPPVLSYWSTVSRRIAREIERIQPDVVHVQDGAGYAFGWPLELWSRPVVCTIHGILHKDMLVAGSSAMRRHTLKVRAGITKWVEARARARIGHVIVINDYVLEELPDIASLRPHKIPNPVDAAFLEGDLPVHHPRRELRLIQVGVINRRKNALAAIEIAGALHRIGRLGGLDLIGPVQDETYLAQCRAEIDRLGITDKVDVIGSLPAADVVGYIDQSDLLVLTSLQETAPMVIAEAHCRGLPVAAPPLFGMRHMIDDGFNGVFLDQPDADRNAARIIAFADSEHDRAKIARAARREYDIGTIAERTISVYREAISQRTAGCLLPQTSA